MIQIDARGLSCPEPLMLLKMEMDKKPNEPITIVVTEAHAKKNVEKFAVSKGKKVSSTENGSDMVILIE